MRMRASHDRRDFFQSAKGTQIARHGVQPPIEPMVRLKITRQPSGSIDGIQLDDFIVGFTYDVGTMLACYLLSERLAAPVPDDSPALVMPLRTQIRFDMRKGAVVGKVVPIQPERRFQKPRLSALSEAADRQRRRKRR
jgi:hypothetical protein